MLVSELQLRVAELFASNRGLDAARLRVDYVLNEGGFVNHSFRISDGRTRLHLKLATSEDAIAALRRWSVLRELLERHRAPRIIDWIELDGAAGLLFPALSGSAPPGSAEVLREVAGALEHLWADGELAGALQADSVNAADTYLQVYHDRFHEDLAFIGENRPPFITDGRLRFMEQQSAALEDIVRSSAAFAETLKTPVHRDAWLENVLWVDRAEWHLLDWDDVSIGDPMIDLAMLTGPTITDLRPLKLIDQLEVELTEAERERLQLLGRAALLDWVIDPVADWIAASVAPEHELQVKAQKQRTHEAALSLYHELYG